MCPTNPGARENNTACLQGRDALPHPLEGFYAVVNEGEFSPSKSVKLFDKPGISTIPTDPPIFVKCADGRCKGGPKFECEHGYRGTACAECSQGQFYWNGKCDTDCKDIEPQGVVTVFGILGVMLVWLILNKSAGGMCAAPHLPGLLAPRRRGRSTIAFGLCADSNVSMLESRELSLTC